MRLKNLLMTPVLALMLAFACLSSNALAQGASPAPSPAPQAAFKTIFDYRKEIGLTEKQATDIRAALKGLQQRLASLTEQLQAADKKCTQTIASEAPIAQIRAALQEMANITVEMRIADVETSRKVNSILSSDQLAKWREIQKKARTQK